MLRLDLCDYNDAYIGVKERIIFEGDNDGRTRNKKLIFKDNASFRSCISKINSTFTNSAEDLDTVMTMLEWSYNYSMTSESLQNYYRDEINDYENENNANNNRINNDNTITNRYFEYKTKIIGKTQYDNDKFDTEVVVPLKYLSNFSIFH